MEADNRMDTPLFRPQAVGTRQSSEFGRACLASPLSHWVWTIGSLTTAVSIVLWLVFGHYTRRERVSGVLVPTAGLVRLAAREAGTVTDVLISEGDAVASGQALVRISREKRSQLLGNVGEGTSTSLASQDLALQSEVLALDDLAAAQRDALGRSEFLLNRKLGELGRQMDLAYQQSVSHTALLDRLRSLSKQGYVSLMQIQQQETQTLDSRSQVESLKRQKTDIELQLSEVRNQLAQLPATSKSKRSELNRHRTELHQAMLEAEVNRSTSITAPREGIVSSLLAVVGQAVSSGETLLALVPPSTLEAQLLVPSSAIGFIRVGTKVHLHYAAFPYQKFGIQTGRVSQVSRNALTASESMILGVEADSDRKPRYRVRVALDRQTISAYGQTEQLLPGMALEADLMLDRRRLLEWLLEPLFGARNRMMAAQS
jgi:membrane fusion protein